MGEAVRFPAFREVFLKLKGDMTTTDFAKKLGMSRATVGFYEAGQRIPDALGVKKIAEVCGVSADYLLGITTEKTSDVKLKALYDDLCLSEKSVGNIRYIKKQNLDDGLNLILEGDSLIDIVRHVAYFRRRCKYIESGNVKFWGIESRARQIQKENPNLIVFYGQEALEYEVSQAEKELRNLLRFDTGYMTEGIVEKIWEWEESLPNGDD